MKQEQEFDPETGKVKLSSTYKQGDEKQPESTNIYADGKLTESRKKTKDGEKITRYRPDGSLYSEKTPNQDLIYDRDGRVKEKRYLNEDHVKVTERYNEDGSLYTKEVYTDSQASELKERTVYNKDGSEYIKTAYGKNGEIVDYTKNPRIGGKRYDNFSEKKLDGKISTKFKQGKAGTCYIASTVQSFMLTKEGKKIINDSLEYDPQTETSTVNFKGAKKRYSFSKDEVKKAMGRLGTGDPDFTVLVMGYEKYRSENLGRVVDGGLGNEVMFALCGNKGENNLVEGFGTMRINGNLLDKLQAKLAAGNAVVTAGTPIADENTEFSKKDEKAGFVNNHAYCVSKITDKYVYVINPTDQKLSK